MLRNLNGLTGYKILAADGELGKVDEFYFDDSTWQLRYMVVKTGGWLSGRKVLISPAAMRAPDPGSKILPVALTLDQVRRSPDIDTELTVTRRHELELHQHYAWPIYWGDGFYAGSMSGGTMFPPAAEDEKEAEAAMNPGPPAEETRLQSTRDVAGYRLHAADGLIGHVEDYIVDDQKWLIRYLVADTGVWLPGRKVLVSPHWIENVDWESSEVYIDLTREAIEKSPEYDPNLPVSEDYADGLHDHYGRPKLEGPARHGAEPAGGRKR